MISNVKTKKRLMQVFIAFLCVCLTVTGGYYIFENLTPGAAAATRTANVNSVSSWNTAINNASSGDVLNITLTGDVVHTDSVTSSGVTSSSGYMNAIPAGVTVNLNMNGKSIYWDTQGSGGDYWRIMSTSYPLNTRFWGLITNRGTLNITGTGTIRMKKICYNQKNGAGQNNYGVRSCAIVNSGSGANLTIGSGITVQDYTAMAHNTSSTGSYADQFVYSVAVYNEGTVNTAGHIEAGSFSANTAVTSTNSYHYAFSYGIYGGTVNTTGGSISSIARSGALDSSGTCKNGNHMCQYAIGIFSNNAKVLGDTSISTESMDWMSTTNNNCWGGGQDVSFSAGVMYSGTNYPVIGASVDIASTFNHAGNDKRAYIPGTDLYYTVHSGDNPGNYARRAYTVVGINATNHIAYTIGGESSEKTYTDDGGYFGVGSTATSEEMGNDVNKYNNFNANMKYWGEDAYNDGKISTSYLIDARVASYQKESGVNSNEEKTSQMTNGAPGETGGQFIQIYRYFNGSVSADNLTSVSYSYDNTKQNTRAYVSVAGSPNYTGLIADNNTVVALGGGGISKNQYYYEKMATTFERVNSSTYSGRRIGTLNDWKGGLSATFPTAGASISAGQTLVIYYNYVLRNPSSIRVVAANKGVEIGQYTETTSFTVPYSGRNLVPGTDFNIAIVDMGEDIDVATDDVTDNTIVTGAYNITGNGSGSGNNNTAVNYRYSTDNGVTWTDGLPKNAGSYRIEVKVNADTTFASAGTYNRLGGTFFLNCTITKVDAVFTGPTTATGTYGSNYSELIPFSNYTVKGQNNENITGNLAFSGVQATAYPNAGSYAVRIAFTPSGVDASNYNSTFYEVTLTVNKRAVTVNVGASAASYGDSDAVYSLDYAGLAPCDESLKAGWLNTSDFEIQVGGTWRAYNASVAVGSYPARIASFGGSTNENNVFTLNSQNGTLVVGKRAINYVATATDRAYNGSNSVNVTLTYVSGAIGTDVYDNTISAVGIMNNPNAGQGKAVNVDADAIDIRNSNNYRLVIGNADVLTVNISKADPTGVACSAGVASVVYDSTRTLNSITLIQTASAIPGTWAWENTNIVPTVDVHTYVAVFTPVDINNYNTITQDVALTVTKKNVIVSVAPQNITYGDSIPAISGSKTFTGFTGTDSFDNVLTTGEAQVSTTYTRGANAGTYPINVTCDLASVNYSFTAQNSTITVGKKNLTVTANDDSVVYGAAVPSYDASDITATGFYGSDNLASLGGTVVVSTTYVVGNGVGEYNINVSGYTSQNYNITYVPGTLTVTKAVLTVAPTAQTVTYGADAPAYAANGLYTVTGYVAGDTAATVAITGAPAFTTAYSSGKNVGTYPVVVTVSGMSSANYSFEGADGALVVEKATPVVATAPTANVVNGNTYATAVFTSGYSVQNPNKATMNVIGTWAFDSAESVAVYGADGFKTATYTPADTTNYNTVSSSIYLTIEMKDISGTPIITGSPMVGKVLKVNFDTMDPAAAQYYTVQWYRGSNAIAGAIGTNYTVVEADKGYTIHAVIVANESLGYRGSASTANTAVIIRALQDLTAAQLTYVVPQNVTYNAQNHPATVSVASQYAGYVGAITVKYNGETTIPKNAGTYVVTVDAAAPELRPGDSDYTAAYYGPVSGLVLGTFTIEKANYNVVINAQDKVYDGHKNAVATIATSGVFGSDNVSLVPDYTYEFVSVNVGNNVTVKAVGLALTGSNANNYKLNVTDGKANITPATLTARAAGVSRDYNGATTVAVTFSNIAGYADVDSSATVYITNGTAVATKADVGEQSIYGITGVLAGSSASNYVLSITNEATATVTITPATPTPNVPVVNGVIYDSAKTLQSISLVSYTDSNGYWQFDDLTVVPTVSTTKYAATYKSTNKNYKDVQALITVNVTPATVTLAVKNKMITYGQDAPTYEIVATGFTGDDTLNDIGGSYTFSCTYSRGASVGSYDVVINCALDSDNYDFVTVPGALTVAPATINVNAASVNKVYDGGNNVTVNFNIVSGKYGNDDVALSYNTTTGYAATENAGTSVVSYAAPALVGTKAGNYEILVTPASGVLTVDIAKADVVGVIFPTAATVEFGYDLTYAEFENAGQGAGTFAYENAKNTIPGALGEFNTYTVVFTPNDSRNYNSQSAVVKLIVVKCQLDYIVGIAGDAQEGQTLNVVITGMPPRANDYIKYQWYRVSDSGADAIIGANSDTYVATADDVGCTLYVITSFDSSAPFEFSDNAIVDTLDGVIHGIIGRTANAVKAIKLSFWQRLMDWFYRLIAAITGLTLGAKK